MSRDEMFTITQDFIQSGASGKGGWTAKQLRLLGVSWPPQNGWRSRIVGRQIPRADAEQFLAIKGKTLAKERAEVDPTCRKVKMKMSKSALIARCDALEARIANLEREFQFFMDTLAMPVGLGLPNHTYSKR